MPDPLYSITLAATLPALSFSATLTPNSYATFSAALPNLSVSMASEYKSYAARPVSSQAANDWHGAAQVEIGAAASHQRAERLKPEMNSRWQPAAISVSGVEALKPKTLVRRAAQSMASHTEAKLVRNAAAASNANAIHDRRAMRSSRFTEANHALRTHRAARHQDGIRTSRATLLTNYGPAVGSVTGWEKHFQTARLLHLVFGFYRQNAQKPPAGMYIKQVIPIDSGARPCYVKNGHLVFKNEQDASTNLLFLCDHWYPPAQPEEPAGQIVVPIRTVYMQINTQSLVFAETGNPIEASSINLSIDVDSWVWGWSANVPAEYLSQLQTDFGNSVELLATLNGTSFSLVVERLQRTREFGKTALAISGRGRAAWLGAPYSSVATRRNEFERTAQQLMADALTINGVSNGWAVDWQITDWLVSAGAWSHTGTPIDACLAIAQAAGAYVHADRINSTLHVLPRYPTAPWQWESATPDIVLPENVCITEGIEFQDKPDYNAVFVSGEAGGIMGYVRRVGTAGEKAAAMVVDPLITHADAARQRGTAILADTGRKKIITLQMPMLAETGIIIPGKMIKYSEGGRDHIGISRAVSVTSEFPKIRQSVTVESHVL